MKRLDGCTSGLFCLAIFQKTGSICRGQHKNSLRYTVVKLRMYLIEVTKSTIPSVSPKTFGYGE